MMELVEAVDLLEIELSSTAEWRRAKAIQYPDDRRNVEAAEILDLSGDGGPVVREKE